MKLTKSTIKNAILESLGQINICQEVDGDQLVSDKLKKHSKFEWELRSNGFNGIQTFSCTIGETEYPARLYLNVRDEEKVKGLTPSGFGFSLQYYEGHKIGDSYSVYDDSKQKFKTVEEMIQALSSIDATIETYLGNLKVLKKIEPKGTQTMAENTKITKQMLREIILEELQRQEYTIDLAYYSSITKDYEFNKLGSAATLSEAEGILKDEAAQQFYNRSATKEERKKKLGHLAKEFLVVRKDGKIVSKLALEEKELEQLGIKVGTNSGHGLYQETVRKESKCPCSEKSEEIVDEGILDFLKGSKKEEPAKRSIPQVRTSPVYASKLAKTPDEYGKKLEPVRQASLKLEDKA